MRHEEQHRAVTPGAVYVNTPANARNIEHWRLHRSPPQQVQQQQQRQQQYYYTRPLAIVPPEHQVVGALEESEQYTRGEVQRHDTEETADQSDLDTFNAADETMLASSTSHTTTTTESTAPHFLGSARIFLKKKLVLIPRVKWTKSKKQQPPKASESEPSTTSSQQRAQNQQEGMAQPNSLRSPTIADSTNPTPIPTISSSDDGGVQVMSPSTTNAPTMTTTTTTTPTTTHTSCESLGDSHEVGCPPRQGDGACVMVQPNPLERRLGVRRGRRHFSLEPSIPEDDVLDESESAQGDIEPSNTQEEVEREDRMVDQILEVFPHVDRRETYRLVREGMSMRRVLSRLCDARRASSSSSSEFDLRSTGTSMASLSEHGHDDEQQSSDNAADLEVESMIQQIKEAFPDVDVDRSYSLLQSHSLDHVMNKLAEESLNHATEFEVSPDSTRTGHEHQVVITEDEQLVYLQEAFPGVGTNQLRCLLRQNSVSSVVLQLCSESASSELRDTGRHEQLHQSLLRSIQYD